MGDISKWQGVDLPSIHPQDIYLMEIGAESPAKPVSDVQKSRNQKQVEVWKPRIAKWNTIGQYVQVGGFVFPFEVAPVRHSHNFSQIDIAVDEQVLFFRKQMFPCWRTRAPIGKQDTTEVVYRLKDAPASEPWRIENDLYESLKK